MSKRSSGNDGNPANGPKFDKSVMRMTRRGSYSKMRSHDRLAGGADAKSKTSLNANASRASVVTSARVTTVASSSSKVAPEAEEEIEAIPSKSTNNVAESTSDRKVDEMIDYVIQNLQEAGKALASLGENFEHDLKLVFVDVMAKVQNWVGLAQLRLDTAKTDLKGLRKELIFRSNEIATRDNEIAELRVKLAETEVAKNLFEKALTENAQRGVGPIPSPSTMTFVPSRQPMPAGSASAHSADSQHLPGTTAASLHPVDPSAVSALSGISSTDRGSGGASSYPDAAGVAGAASLRSTAPAGTSLHPIGADAPLSSQGEAVSGQLTSSAAALHQAALDQLSRAQQAGATVERSGISGAQPASHPAGSPAREDPATADVAVQSGKGKDRGKRESELESELARLRKENEKIVKERADYENAIQRALLRGVSSLNVETLKVLRCPPVSCYTPCGPPPSPVNTVEALIPCPPKKMKDNWTPTGCRTTMSGPSRHGGSRIRANATTAPEQEHVCCGKRPNTSSCGLSLRNKKSPDNSSPSMIFLLPQDNPPKVCANTKTPQNRTCVRPKSKKLDHSVCMKRVG